MLDVFRLFSSIWQAFSALLDSLILNLGGVSISYLDVLIGFICLGMVVTFYWKGAHQ